LIFRVGVNKFHAVINLRFHQLAITFNINKVYLNYRHPRVSDPQLLREVKDLGMIRLYIQLPYPGKGKRSL